MRSQLLLTLAALSAALATPAWTQDKPQVTHGADVKWGPCDPNTATDPCKINYFRGNPEKEENYGFIKVPKGHSFPPHWHIHNENLIMLRGTLVVGAEDDAKGTPLRPGDYMFLPAKWIHWAKCAEQDCLFYLNNEGADSYIEVKDKRP